MAVVSFKVLWGLRAGHLLIMCILIHSVVMMLSSVVLRGLDGGRVLYRSTRTVLSTVYLYSYIVWEHKSDANNNSYYGTTMRNIYNISSNSNIH